MEKKIKTLFGSDIIPFEKRHVTLNVDSYRQIIIVGDIHGCFQSFRNLLIKTKYNKNFDLLLSVGDLVNKGSQSSEVLNYFYENKILFTRGNHEERLLNDYYLSLIHILRCRRRG